jgi:hypothetical protein
VLWWVHEIVHWPSVADEWTRMHDILTQRHEMRMQGRKMHEILRKHPTGYSFFDNHEKFAFSKVGDALRRMWHRRVNGTDAHFVNHTRSHADHAGKHAPERHGRLRRLSEGFLGPVVAAPYALFDTVLYGTVSSGAGAVTVPETGEDIFTAAIRYLVYGTIGCYLTEPTLTPSSTSIENPNDPSEGADGDTLKVFRPDSTFLCFPAVPFVLPLMPTWREFTKSEGVEYHKLTYEVRTHLLATPHPPCPFTRARSHPLDRRSIAPAMATRSVRATFSRTPSASASSRRRRAGSASRARCAAPRRSTRSRTLWTRRRPTKATGSSGT